MNCWESIGSVSSSVSFLSSEPSATLLPQIILKILSLNVHVCPLSGLFYDKSKSRAQRIVLEYPIPNIYKSPC